MKKYLILLFVIFISKSTYSQFAVVDANANIKLTQQTLIQNIMKGFSKIQANIASDALDEGIKHTDFLDKQFTLLDNVYKVSSSFNNMKRVRTYFDNSSQLIRSIGQLTRSLSSNQSKFLNPQERKSIKNELDNSIDQIKYSLEIISFAMNPTNKLSIAERLKEVDEANEILSKTTNSVAASERKINTYRYRQETTDKRNKLNSLLYQ